MGRAVVYRCKGAFSLANHAKLGELAEDVRRGDGAQVVLDLREVVYMDSVGVGTVAVMLKDTRARGRALAVVPTADIRTLLGASKLDGILPFAGSPEAAMGK
ncbi:MAG: STAS domain-containing protein [Candidatus Acidiferrales bacterium]